MSNTKACIFWAIYGFILGIDCCLIALTTGTLTVTKYASCADVPPSVHFDVCTGKIKGEPE